MKKLKKLLYSWIERLFLGGCSSFNSLQVRKSCRSKLQARDAFAKHGIPYAVGQIFLNPFTAHRFANEHDFPLCIKPNVSGFSRGSHFPITNFFQLWKAAVFVKIWWPTSVVEKYLQGRNYRVLVANGKIMSVIRRYPPFVDGDGVSSIDQLIDHENNMRKQLKLYPVIHPIPKDSKIRKYLDKQGRTLQSVPSKSERITLFNRISLAPGGVVEIVDKQLIPDINKELFINQLGIFKANILGVDAIFEKGIENDFREQNCIFLEVNSRPYLKMHDFPRFGEKEDLTSFFLELEKGEITDADIF